MTATFHYTKTDTSESLIVSGQVVRTVASSHPNFIKIRDYLFAQNDAGDEIDLDHVLKLIDAGLTVVDTLLRVTDRVSYKGGNLLWDGEPIENALSAHIVRMIKAGDENYTAFAKFLENLDQNPSQASRDALFEWVADRDLTITPEGHFVAYKGVTRDYKSLHGGYGIVNGVEHNGALDNTPGNVVEVPRNRVDPNRDSACSYGLHVGTRPYANDYGNHMVIVAVNPRDVVMVPRDGGGEKMRVCKYTVLDDNDAQLTVTTYTGAHRSQDTDEAENVAQDGFEDDEDDSCPCCGANSLGGELCSHCEREDITLCLYCGEDIEEGETLCDDCQAEEDEEARHDEQQGDGNFCGYCGAEMPDGYCPNR